MLFALLFLTVVAAINRYLWVRLVRDTRLGRPVSRLASALLVALTASVPLALVLWAAWSRAFAPRVNFVAFSWLGLSFYLLMMFAAWDVARVAAWVYVRVTRLSSASSRQRGPLAALAHKPESTSQAPRAPNILKTSRLRGFAGPRAPARLLNVGSTTHRRPAGTRNPAKRTDSSTFQHVRCSSSEAPQPVETRGEPRRVFLARSVASGALLATSGIGAFGVRSALWDITTPETAIALARLPRALDGFSIALLTDIHIGPLLDGRFLRQLVEQTNRLRPDLVAIGGDLVDGKVGQIGDQVAELRRLQSKYGVYFVTGNHEYYAGVGRWVEFLERLGIGVLINRSVRVGDATHAGASFDLAGVPDALAGRAGAEEPHIQRATAGRDPERELVVLAHQPVQIADSAQVSAGLQLSGHTHGGQLYPFGVLTRLAQPYLAGLHSHAGSDTQIYVSRGAGFWGPPMRVLAPAEIALLRLHAGSA